MKTNLQELENKKQELINNVDGLLYSNEVLVISW